MKAVLARAFGPIENLTVAEAPEPAAGPGEVLIEVAAAGVNFPDLLVIGGKYQIAQDPPFIPGKEASGIVLAIGDGVTTCRPGDRVLVMIECGTYCQRLVAPAANVFVLPEAMHLVAAGAFALTYQTAHFALVERAATRQGETVLVTGAAGGVGLACVALAKALGARVIAGVGSPEKGRVASAAGADHVIDLSGGNLRDSIREQVFAVTQGKGADVICEVVGADVFDGALRALAWSGRLVVLGFAGGRIPSIPANYILVKNITVTGLHWSDYREWHPERMRAAQADLFRLWEAGKLPIAIAGRYPMERVVEALSQLRDRKVLGKVVLTMES